MTRNVFYNSFVSNFEINSFVYRGHALARLLQVRTVSMRGLLPASVAKLAIMSAAVIVASAMS